MREMREWAAAFLAASSTIETIQRPVGSRSKITWPALPVRRGAPIRMSADHGHVYMALVAHTPSNADHDADSIQSDASVDQIIRQSFLSPSTVEGLLRDLRAVGFVSSERRFNKSSLTTIFRTPGNFVGATPGSRSERQDRCAVKEDLLSIHVPKADDLAEAAVVTKTLTDTQAVTAPRKVSAAPDSPAPLSTDTLAGHIATALYSAGLRICDEDLTLAQMAEHLTRTIHTWEAHTLFTRSSADRLECLAGCTDEHIAVIEPLLPKDRVLAVSYFGGTRVWAILKRPEVIARELLTEACGHDATFGGFPAATRSHPALPLFLAALIHEGSGPLGHIWKGITTAKNPAAYLQKVVGELLAEEDEG